jgi:hypothetical protein
VKSWNNLEKVVLEPAIDEDKVRHMHWDADQWQEKADEDLKQGLLAVKCRVRAVRRRHPLQL